MGTAQGSFWNGPAKRSRCGGKNRGGRLARAKPGAGHRQWTEALRAPTSGIIASSSAINGQVVEAKEVLFEIIDPRHMLIEALAYDPNSIRGIRGAMLAGSATELVYLGGAASLRDGAIPLFFRFTGTEMPLVLGQSVKLIVSRQETLKGTPLPHPLSSRTARMKTSSGHMNRRRCFDRLRCKSPDRRCNSGRPRAEAGAAHCHR